ncbi:MAG: glycosyl transferase family 51 [Sphingomonas bacterium]|uniref:biosynthetic peptidoglycan transglycosylase n=1 Tax=Sphingomonas bacterium TaxID=1895847 RepID=UPI002608BC67|nr:biosynthetic peptidoglycan transglycosylase [Sphingomonas bacterium]MDB5709919.1 glycosyl transferase family 51 [Sphingomonas bacterium]
MRQWAKRGAMAAAAIILLLLAWEAFTVIRARSRTQAILAANAHPATTIDQIGARRVAMLLKVEDPGFFHHHGVDFSTPGQGATTMTQSLVKRLYFPGGFSPGFAKIEQSLIARFVFDPATTKRQQLDMFLNLASFGNEQGRQVTGFADAARTFFGKPLAALDDRQFISLVAMLIAPNALDPVRHAGDNAERARRIMALLAGRCRPRGVTDVRYPDCATADGKPRWPATPL